MDVADLNTIGHEINIRPRGVVSPRIGKHQLHVIMELLRLLVSGSIKLALDGGKVNRLSDDNGIVLEDGYIYRLGKRESPLRSTIDQSVVPGSSYAIQSQP